MRDFVVSGQRAAPRTSDVRYLNILFIFSCNTSAVNGFTM